MVRRGNTPNTVTVEYRNNYVSATDASSYTFSAVDIGADSGNRTVIVGVLRSNESNVSGFPTSVTVGGVSATLIGEVNVSTTSTLRVASFWRVVVSGTSATVVVSGTSTSLNCGIAIWRLTSTTTPQFEVQASTAAITGTSFTLTFASVSQGNAIMCLARIRSANVGTYSLSGVTENFEVSTESGVNGMLGGSTNINSSSTNYNVTATTSGASPSWAIGAIRAY